MLVLGYFGNLSGLELRAEEPRRAVVSMEMLLTGEYIVPHINGTEYYNKPPVFNWIMAGFMKLFGSFDEWVVRLPSLLSLLLLAWLNFKFVARRIGKEVALFSSLALLTSADILFYGGVNTGEIDLFYALICVAQFFVIFHYEQKSELLKLFVFSYLLTAVGFLTKGMPSLAFQALCILAWFIYKKRFRSLFSWQHISGIMSMLLALFVYFRAYAAKADWQVFLVRQFKEASQRTAAESSFTDVILQVFSFPVQYLVLVLPWALLIIFLLRKGVIQQLKKNELIYFFTITFMVNIILYWSAGEFKARYYYMFLPLTLNILFYLYFEAKANDGKQIKTINIIFKVISVILMIILFVGAYYLIKQISVINVLILLLSIILGAFFILLIFKTDHRILALIGMLALVRIIFNYTYIPEVQKQSEELSYRSEIKALMKETKDEQILLLGDPYVFDSDVSIGPLKFKEVELRTAPLIAYQIPYYISSQNSKVLEFREEMKDGHWYLVPEEKMKGLKAYKDLKITDRWMNRNYHLVSTHSQASVETE